MFPLVYRFENENLYNVYHSKNRASRKKIKLLLLMEGTKSHYCLIKNFSNVIHRLHRSSKKRFKGPKSKIAAIVFNRLCEKTIKNIWSFVKSTSLWKYKCPKMGRLYLSAIGRKRNGALSLCMLIWKQLMLNVMKLAHQHRTPPKLKGNIQPVLALFFSTREQKVLWMKHSTEEKIVLEN